MAPHPRNLAWLALLACPSALAIADGAGPIAQGRPEAEINKQISEHLAVFRDKHASTDDREQATRELVELGWRGPQRLAAELTRRAHTLERTYRGSRKKLVKAFDKRARVVVGQRLTKSARAEIQRLRDVVLKAARDSELSKDRIRAESDPAMARLRELQTVSVADVWAADEKLRLSYGEVLDLITRHRELCGYQERARGRLEAHPEAPASAKRLKQIKPLEEQTQLDTALAALADDATPMSDSDRKRLTANAALRDQIDAQELAGIAHLNQIRILLGLSVQAIDVKLCTAARDHSKDMAERGFFSHTSPVEGKTTPWMRAAAAGTSASAENIARGAATGVAAITQWWYSPGHHRNMLRGQSRTGLGRYRTTWTQLFG